MVAPLVLVTCCRCLCPVLAYHVVNVKNPSESVLKAIQIQSLHFSSPPSLPHRSITIYYQLLTDRFLGPNLHRERRRRRRRRRRMRRARRGKRSRRRRKRGRQSRRRRGRQSRKRRWKELRARAQDWLR